MQLLALIGAAFLVYWVLTHLGLVFGLIFAFAKFIILALGALVILGIVIQMIPGKRMQETPIRKRRKTRSMSPLRTGHGSKSSASANSHRLMKSNAPIAI